MAYCNPAGLESDDDSDGLEDYFGDTVEAGLIASAPTAAKTEDEIAAESMASYMETHQPVPAVNKLLNKRDKNITPSTEDFHSAIFRSNVPLIKELLATGFAIDTVLKGGWNGLMTACSIARPEIVELLLQNGANPTFHKDFFTPLMAACSSSCVDNDSVLACVEQLLAAGAKVNEKDRYHMTALSYAARDGRLEVVRQLLAAGADVNMHDSRGFTPLALAAQKGQGPIVRLLLDSKADHKKVCNTGQTPSDLAYYEGHTAIADILEGIDTQKESTDLLDDIKPTQKEVEYDEDDEEDVDNNFNCKYYEELEMLVAGLGLHRLMPVFKKHEITYDLLLRMSDADLEKIGVSEFGVRQKILDTIYRIHKTEWEAGSIGSLEAKRRLTCADATNMTANVAKHCIYINSSIAYLLDKIKANPAILELGQEGEDVHVLLKNVQEAKQNADKLGMELSVFAAYLDKIKYNPNLNSGDLVPRKKKGLNKSWKTLSAMGIAVVIVVGGGFYRLRVVK